MSRYIAVTPFSAANPTTKVAETLSDQVRQQLLAFAREALSATANRAGGPRPPTGEPFDTPAAVFVTLRRLGDLRGCMGRICADTPLGEVVNLITQAAASRDPRFPPVTPEEVPEITIEISRLTDPEAATVDDVVPGRHGVIVSKGGRSGLLLPQVAVEHGCDAPGFLALACQKAGLQPLAWKDEEVIIQTFEAEVFGE